MGYKSKFKLNKVYSKNKNVKKTKKLIKIASKSYNDHNKKQYGFDGTEKMPLNNHQIPKYATIDLFCKVSNKNSNQKVMKLK